MSPPSFCSANLSLVLSSLQPAHSLATSPASVSQTECGGAVSCQKNKHVHPARSRGALAGDHARLSRLSPSLFFLLLTASKSHSSSSSSSILFFFPSLRVWLCGAWLQPTCQIAGLRLQRFLSRPRRGKYGKWRGYHLGSPWHVQLLGSVIPEVRELARQSGCVCQLPRNHIERNTRASVEGGTLQSSGGLAAWVWKSGT